MKIFLYVPLIICLVGCSKDSKTSDKGGAAKDQKVKTEPLPDFPDPMTKEFIMAMWEAPHNVEGIIPEMEQVLLKEGVWKVERKIGPNKNELEDVPAASMTFKFTKRRFHIWKFSFEDFVQFSLMTFDYEKESYRWWYLMPDDFIGENSGNIAEGENFIWESVVMPEENGEGVKMKSVEDLSLRKTNEDPVTIEIQMLRKDEIIWVAEDTLTWASELPKEGDFESNIAGKAISIEVKEGTKKNRMLFDFGEDRVLRLYEDGELVDESMSYRVDGLEVKFLARKQEDAQALDRLAMRMLFSSEDPKLGDEIIMKDRNNSFAGKIVKFDELAKVLKENLLEQEVSYGRLKETFDGKYLYKGKPFTGKVHGGTGGGNRFEGNIVKGKWEGIWTEWDKDGNKIQEDLYKNGELVSSDKLEDNPKVVEEVKIKRPKLTPKQISDHLEFWTGKWKGYDKVTNQIFDSFEAKWKEKGVSLEFKGIIFEAGEQKDTYTGSIYYDKDLGVFVDTGTYEKSSQTLVRHAILDPESGESNGFAVKPKPPEGMEVKFKWKKLDRNTVDYFFEVVQGGDTLEEKEFVIKRQGVEPKEDSNQTKTSEFPDLIEEVDTEKIITLSVDGNEVTATRIIEGFPEFDFFYITSSGAFSIDELRIGKTRDSVTQESVPDDDENIIFYDSFEYSDGEKLIDQKNWYSEGLPRHISNSPDTYTISKGSLVSDGIKSVGNRVSTEATDAISGIGIELPDAASFDPDDNVFISFLIRPEGVIGDGVWGGYFSFGAKPFDGKGLLFGKPGNSSAPDDKKYAIDKQGGPLILTSGVETEVDKTSYVVIKIESPAIDKQAQVEAGNLLKKNIADKLITFGSEEREHGLQLQFNANGEMLMGADYDLSDRGSYTYKINGSEVMVYQGAKRDGGVLFPSVNPKVGDEVELGPENDKDKVTIKKIESVDNVVVAPEKQKDFAELENPKLTPKQLAEKISEKLKSKILEFKPIKGIADQAKRAEAMNEVNQLKIAISAYELEYAKLPFQARNAGEADLRMDTFKDNLISVLSGYNIDGLNPRKQPFYQGKRAKGRDSQKPTSGVFGTDEKLKLADPWGNAYSIVFDSNNDLTLKGLPGTGGKEVRASVVIWSTGGADDQKKFDPEKWIKSW